MWKAVLCVLVVLVCLELSVEARHHGHKRGNKRTKPAGEDISDDHQLPWGKKGGKGKKDFKKKISNPEMMMMMRMKKMLMPLRQLFTKVLDLGPRESIDGQPEFCRDNECPEYTVLNETEHYEIRQYMPSNWVSTSIKAESLTSEIQRNLFWPLFSYIEGANANGQKIKMTVPVTTVVRPDVSAGMMNYTMSFYMPNSLGLPPSPKNSKLFVQQKGGFKVFVHSFKGYAWGQEVWEKHAAMLQKHLIKDGFKGKFHPRKEVYLTAGYDDPMKIFNRHNEVWLVCKDH
jgi:hypothetical protein